PRGADLPEAHPYALLVDRGAPQHEALEALVLDRRAFAPVGIPEGDRVLADELVGVEAPRPQHELRVRRLGGRIRREPARGLRRHPARPVIGPAGCWIELLAEL